MENPTNDAQKAAKEILEKYGKEIYSFNKYDEEDIISAMIEFASQQTAPLGEVSVMEDVEIIFSDNNGERISLTVTAAKLIEENGDYFRETLETSGPCSCFNEGQNFCECEPMFENFDPISIRFQSLPQPQAKEADERIVELTTALSDMIKMARLSEWQQSLTGRQIVLKNAEQVVSNEGRIETDK